MIGVETSEERAERLARVSYEAFSRRMDERDRDREERSITAFNGSPGLEPLANDRSGFGPRNTGFSSFGEQMRAVVDASTPGRAADPRLFQGMEQRAASGLNETVGTEGGFLVEQASSDKLLRMAIEASQLAQRCTATPIPKNANGIKLPYAVNTDRRNGARFGGIQLFWVDEAGEKLPSKPTFSYVSLQLRKLIGLVYVTDEILDDVLVLDSFLQRAFRSEFSFVLDDAIIRGTGAGQPLGVLNSAAKVTVAKETGQAAATINFTNIAKMFSRLPASSLMTAAWIVNSDTSPQLMALSDQNGNSIYLPPGGLNATPYARLMGLPVIPVEQAETLGTEGDIMLLDLSRYLLADKGGIQTSSSIHVRYVFDETCFRFVLRIDGQPELNAPITPYKGTATKSPFIVLATRA